MYPHSVEPNGRLTRWEVLQKFVSQEHRGVSVEGCYGLETNSRYKFWIQCISHIVSVTWTRVSPIGGAFVARFASPNLLSPPRLVTWRGTLPLSCDACAERPSARTVVKIVVLIFF